MCLIICSWQPYRAYPLILAANRDEYYQRPTAPVHYWEDNPNVFGGRDLLGGGSWLAINRQGKFAAVTNYRKEPQIKGSLSRGQLVSDFVSGNQSARQYLQSVIISKNDYSPFNLLVGDKTGIYYCSSQLNDFTTLQPGLFGLSNHLLNTPWPKLENSINKMSSLLNIYDYNPSDESIVELMHDDTRPADTQLPNTGVGIERERLLSPCFIKSDTYGTRNTSILKFDSEGSIHWYEQIYCQAGQPGKHVSYSIPLSSGLYQSNFLISS